MPHWAHPRFSSTKVKTGLAKPSEIFFLRNPSVRGDIVFLLFAMAVGEPTRQDPSAPKVLAAQTRGDRASRYLFCRWPDQGSLGCMDSKLAAARVDFVELLAGDGAVFLHIGQTGWNSSPFIQYFLHNMIKRLFPWAPMMPLGWENTCVAICTTTLTM